MLRVSRMPGVFVVMWQAAMWLAFAPTGCSAQQQQKAPLPFAEHKFLERAVRISARQKSLADFVEYLAATAKISIVTDGVPDRVAANLEVDGTVREALDKLAAGFDCGWSVSKSGIVMIARRFADETEHPQIHLKEMQQMVRDIHAALQLVPPEVYNMNCNVLLNQLEHSFTPTQMAACKDGTLTGADLDTQQFSCLNSAIQNYTFAFAIRWRYLTPVLMDGMPSSFLQLKPMASPDKYLDPTNQFSNAARFPSYDYLYIIRGKNGKLVTEYLPKIQVN